MDDRSKVEDVHIGLQDLARVYMCTLALCFGCIHVFREVCLPWGVFPWMVLFCSGM